jgi:hypothetical protein
VYGRVEKKPYLCCIAHQNQYRSVLCTTVFPRLLAHRAKPGAAIAAPGAICPLLPRHANHPLLLEGSMPALLPRRLARIRLGQSERRTRRTARARSQGACQLSGRILRQVAWMSLENPSTVRVPAWKVPLGGRGLLSDETRKMGMRARAAGLTPSTTPG